MSEFSRMSRAQSSPCTQGGETRVPSSPLAIADEVIE
jgi:hypothetical protein